MKARWINKLTVLGLLKFGRKKEKAESFKFHPTTDNVQGYYKRNRHFQRYVISPDLTPCDFFLWGYITDRIFVPPLPVSLNKLKQRITTAVASVDEDMLRSVWDRIRLSCDKRLAHRTFVT